ncbi:C10 family peptidase [bacterium]|nr:C10 family peptidase [bacterium]
MKRYYLLIILLIGLKNFPVSADSVTENEAYRSAVAWFNTCPAFVRSDVGYTYFSDMISVMSDDHSAVLAYVLNLDPYGYIIVTSDNGLSPVIAYSEYSIFNNVESSENILLSFLRKDIPGRLAAVEAGLVEPEVLETRRADREADLAMISPQGQMVMKVAVQTVYAAEYGPLLASEWGQGNDGGGNNTFDYYTPYNYVCGCVATAMGQILNYYTWPASGTGSSSYTWNNGSDPSQSLSANYGETDYDWMNMLDIYHNGSKAEAERQAAGQFVYHCGVALEMNYASSGSGASTSAVALALENYFRTAGTWISSSVGDFFTQLQTNIANSRPAQMSISGSVGGHSIVVDGFRDTGASNEYHLNMGWNSSNDAWYMIETLPFTAGYEWDTINGAVMDIVPTPDMDDPGSSTTATSVSASWSVSDLLNADYYELKKLYISNTSSSVSDGAETGIGNWTIDGFWAQTSYYQHSGTYSFLGQVYQSGNWDFPGTITYNQSVKITNATTLSYYWASYGASGRQLRLDISIDGVSWTTLKSHDGVDVISWNQIDVTTSDLSGYVGEIAKIRFVVDYLGGSISVGSSLGIYVDDFVISNGRFGSWETVNNSIAGTSQTISTEGNGDYAFQVRANWDSQWWNWSDMESVTLASALVQAKVFLKGPYSTNNDNMSIALRAAGYIPVISPYSEDPRTVSSVPNDVTDWVLVQLRSTETGSAIASRSAFLHKDGRIVGDDGLTGSITLDAAAGNYYIVVKHRNHLAIMSDDAVALASGSSTLYDFTSGTDNVEGADLVFLETGVYGMYAGDSNSSGGVNATDYLKVKTQVGNNGYYDEDVNLNGTINATDYLVVKPSIGKNSNI